MRMKGCKDQACGARDVSWRGITLTSPSVGSAEAKEPASDEAEERQRCEEEPLHPKVPIPTKPDCQTSRITHKR